MLGYVRLGQDRAGCVLLGQVSQVWSGYARLCLVMACYAWLSKVRTGYVW